MFMGEYQVSEPDFLCGRVAISGWHDCGLMLAQSRDGPLGLNH
jgi:hypothetical protein